MLNIIELKITKCYTRNVIVVWCIIYNEHKFVTWLFLKCSIIYMMWSYLYKDDADISNLSCGFMNNILPATTSYVLLNILNWHRIDNYIRHQLFCWMTSLCVLCIISESMYVIFICVQLLLYSYTCTDVLKNNDCENV